MKDIKLLISEYFCKRETVPKI